MIKAEIGLARWGITGRISPIWHSRTDQMEESLLYGTH